jgi:hypothetical protein
VIPLQYTHRYIRPPNVFVIALFIRGVGAMLAPTLEFRHAADKSRKLQLSAELIKPLVGRIGSDGEGVASALRGEADIPPTG